MRVLSALGRMFRAAARYYWRLGIATARRHAEQECIDRKQIDD